MKFIKSHYLRCLSISVSVVSLCLLFSFRFMFLLLSSCFVSTSISLSLYLSLYLSLLSVSLSDSLSDCLCLSLCLSACLNILSSIWMQICFMSGEFGRKDINMIHSTEDASLMRHHRNDNGMCDHSFRSFFRFTSFHNFPLSSRPSYSFES